MSIVDVNTGSTEDVDMVPTWAMLALIFAITGLLGLTVGAALSRAPMHKRDIPACAHVTHYEDGSGTWEACNR